jgi:hypothetical protein
MPNEIVSVDAIAAFLYAVAILAVTTGLLTGLAALLAAAIRRLEERRSPRRRRSRRRTALEGRQRYS